MSKYTLGKPAQFHQTGQALAEALVVCLALLAFWVAIAWLGRYQDIALQASHASRYAAFSQAQFAPLPHDSVRQVFFEGSAHQWADRRGQKLFDGSRALMQLQADRGPVLNAHAQAGQDSLHADVLREQWQVADTGIVKARVGVQFSGQASASTKPRSFMSGLRDFDLPYPPLSRHTAILVGAGHAMDDTAAQQRVAQSNLAWTDVAARSYGLSQQVSSVMSLVDAGWGRAQPEQDWLGAWVGEVPHRHLHRLGEQP